MDKDSQLYEIVYLISPAYSEEEAQNFHQSLKNHMQKLGGFLDASAGSDTALRVGEEKEVVKRRLSYPIKKMTEAYLAHFTFLMPSEKIDDFKLALDAKEVLRYLLVRTKRQPPRPIRARTIKLAGDKVFTKTSEATSETAASWQKPVTEDTERKTDKQSAADIKEIDKKLEEILGK